MAHGGVRARRAVPDAGVRDDGPRPRHEQLDVGRASRIPTTPISRGKLLTAEKLKELGEWGRYKDVDGDGIAYRTIPGDGLPAYFTRGSGHNAKGQYSERPDDYVENMDRLARKFETARKFVPSAGRQNNPKAKIGFIGYGTSHLAIDESRDQLREETDVETSYFRLRALSVQRRARGVHRRARARLRHRAEPRRAAAAADEARAHARAADRSCAACCTTTACRSTPAASPTTCWRRKGSKWRRRRPHCARAARAWRVANRSMATPLKVNRIGLEPQIYKGGKTTLCAGCGHNAISERIIDAFYEMGVDPQQVVKLSGIGCSSKSPAYFLGGSHGFNAVHGRMPSVGTGAMLANKKLIAIGISGDGDTGAIGIGQFVHLMRRNLPIIYIIEDNGCYGLTKGQFSPTADLGSKLKTGVVNDLPPIDTCALAIELGATFVGALVLGRQETAAVAAQGGARASRHRDARRHLAVRHLQRSRRLDQELRLREGSRRSGRGRQLRAVLRGHRGRLRAGHRPQEVTMHDGSKLLSEEARRGLRPDRQDQRAEAPARDRAPRRVRHRPHLHRARSRRFPDPAQRRGRAARDAPAEPHPPRSGGARGDHGRPSVDW